jgi:hypothetical protein
MARTHYVKKAQKDQGSCMSPDCTHESREITVGMPYKHFSIRAYKGGRGTKKVYHSDCRVPQSHTTTSAQLGTIYDAQETASKLLSQFASDGSVDDLRSIAQDAAQGIREAGEMYTESADNMESGFGTSTYISDEIREKGDGCESWADEIESAADDIEDFDEDAARGEAEDEYADEEFDTDEDRVNAVEESVESKRQDWSDEAVNAIEDALNNQPF